MRCSVSRESFANAEFREDDIEQILDINPTRHASKSLSRQAKILGLNIQSIHTSKGPLDLDPGFRQALHVPLPLRHG
jgi:hypothetical protein